MTRAEELAANLLRQAFDAGARAAKLTPAKLSNTRSICIAQLMAMQAAAIASAIAEARAEESRP